MVYVGYKFFYINQQHVVDLQAYSYEKKQEDLLSDF